MTDYKNISIKNKKAYFDYEIVEEYVAGIVLVSSEIKSIRLGKVSLVDCYCYFANHELYVKGVNISEYQWASLNNHVPKRDRKLLLNSRELNKLERTSQEKGMTIIGLRLFINDRGLAKLVIGLARGKREYDKRETIKDRDSQRELSKIKKDYRR